MIGWLETIRVPSKQATKYETRIPEKMSQNLVTLTPARNGDFCIDLSSPGSSPSPITSRKLPTVLAKDFRRLLARLEDRYCDLSVPYFLGPRSIAVSWDSGSIPSPVVMDSALERRASNSFASMSSSVSASSSIKVSSRDIVP